MKEHDPSYPSGIVNERIDMIVIKARKLVTTENNSKIKNGDKAMNKNLGGIDLTVNMNLQTQNAGEEIKFHFDSAMLAQLQNTPGFVPVIIDIQPMTDLPGFLTLNTRGISPKDP